MLYNISDEYVWSEDVNTVGVVWEKYSKLLENTTDAETCRQSCINDTDCRSISYIGIDS